jgi:hypothetical protein
MEDMVRVRDLKATLAEIHGIFVSAGARPQQKAFGRVTDALANYEDDDLDEFLTDLETASNAAVAPLAKRYVDMLTDAGSDEPRFLAVLSQLSADKKVKKPDLQRIVKGFTGAVDRRANAAQLSDEIKKAFYKALYERDARALAKKATPV